MVGFQKIISKNNFLVFHWQADLLPAAFLPATFPFLSGMRLIDVSLLQKVYPSFR